MLIEYLNLEVIERSCFSVLPFGRDGGKWCIIEVEDSGIGIAKENLALIFEEYRQINEGPAQLVKGTGLGLPLCKKYVELLGGAILVQSKLNAGSVFTVSLPVK